MAIMPSRKDFFAKIKKIEDYDGWFHQQPLSTVSQAVVKIFAAEEGPKKTLMMICVLPRSVLPSVA